MYMPMWSVDEVLDYCHYNHLDVDTILQSFYIVGGAARHLFSNSCTECEEIVRRAVDGILEKENLLMFIKSYVECPVNSGHKIVSLNPVSCDYKSYHCLRICS